MLNFIERFFSRNIGLKITALILTLVLWFYVSNELKKGNSQVTAQVEKAKE